MNLIPLPNSITPQDGLFIIDHNTSIVMDNSLDDHDLETAKLLQQEIKKVLGIKLQIKKVLKISELNDNNCICLKYDETEMNKEAYQLTVYTNKIIITACANRGFLYGVATLIQLCKTGHSKIDCMIISDQPSYANRGYMLDVTRGRIPTMTSLKRLIDSLAQYKINQLQLYMENCTRLDGFEEIWSQTDPFTQEEIMELDSYCYIRGIELVPCIATFGHLYDLLRSESFRKYSEIDADKGEPFTWYHRMRYHSINTADPESFALITSILDKYMPLFRSDKINICCDETFDLGKGRGSSLAEQTSYGDMYYAYVNLLVDYIQSRGKKVMIWADIVLNHPDKLDKLNTKVTCLNWYYYYNANEDKLKIFADNSISQYVCPSTSGFSRLVNAYDMSFSNIREMTKLGKQYHAEGVLNTDWGDTGHINMPSLTVPCMIYGAALSWNVEDDRDFATMDQEISALEYGDPDRKLVGLLRELSRQDLIIFNDLAFFRDYKVYNLPYYDFDTCLYDNTKTRIMEMTEEQLKAAVQRCEELIISLKQSIGSLNINHQQEVSEFYLSARGVALMQELALVIKKCEYNQEVDLLESPSELARRLENWLMDYCDAWRAVSRESELYRIKEFVLQICTILRKYENSKVEE